MAVSFSIYSTCSSVGFHITGSFDFLNLDYLKKHQGAAIVVSNHSFVLDLYVPIILNILLKRKVYVLAAVYPMPSKFKRFLASKMGIIFVTRALESEELAVIADDLGVQATKEDIEEASEYYRFLADTYNFKAKARMKKVISEGSLLFSFGQFHQPFFPMERAGAGLGKMISEYTDVPVYPFSIVDISDPPVETRIRNASNNLKRIDLLTDKKRRTFEGEVNISVYEPVLLRENHDRDFQKIIDELMIIIASHLPVFLKGCYDGKEIKEDNRYFSPYRRG